MVVLFIVESRAVAVFIPLLKPVALQEEGQVFLLLLLTLQQQLALPSLFPQLKKQFFTSQELGHQGPSTSCRAV